MKSNAHGLGIGLMLLAMMFFATNDAIGKWLVAAYPVGQLLAVRSAAALVILLVIVWRSRAFPALWQVDRPWLQSLRVVLVAAEVALFYTAVQYLPLADTFMFYLAAPLFLTMFSVVILKEHVGPWRWAAVTIGLVGVVFVFPPSKAALSAPALIALAGSITMALMVTLSRVLRDTDGLTLITLQTIGVTVLAGATLPFAWVTPGAIDFSLMCFLGIVATAAHFLMNKSVAVAPSAVVAPFQYTLIVWGILFGYFVWGDFPTTRALFGAGLIVGAGLLVLYREQRAGQA